MKNHLGGLKSFDPNDIPSPGALSQRNKDLEIDNLSEDLRKGLIADENPNTIGSFKIVKAQPGATQMNEYYELDPGRVDTLHKLRDSLRSEIKKEGLFDVSFSIEADHSNYLKVRYHEKGLNKLRREQGKLSKIRYRDVFVFSGVHDRMYIWKPSFSALNDP